MAQTKRKRKRRHRGTQAGTIDARGRTSKPAADKPRQRSTKAEGRSLSQQRREERLNKPPTWRGALNRAAFAAVILVIFISVVQKNIAQGLVMGVFALVVYVPLSYYTDLALYRRRQRRRQTAGR